MLLSTSSSYPRCSNVINDVGLGSVLRWSAFRINQVPVVQLPILQHKRPPCRYVVIKPITLADELPAVLVDVVDVALAVCVETSVPGGGALVDECTARVDPFGYDHYLFCRIT